MILKIEPISNGQLDHHPKAVVRDNYKLVDCLMLSYPSEGYGILTCCVGSVDIDVALVVQQECFTVLRCVSN